MDIATIVGFIAFVTALMVGVGSNLSLFVDPPSLIIVLGGGIALTLISLPLQHVANLPSIVMRALFVRLTSPTTVIESAVRMAQTARAETIIALEQEVDQNEHDPFFAAGIRLAVDGTEPDLIMDILETELQFIEGRHKQGGQSVALVGRNCVFMGALATLLASVIGFYHDAEPGTILFFSSLGLLYGGIAWALMTAVADKLRRYSEMEALVKRLIIEAIMSIQSGNNPRIVEHKLSVFLQPAMRPSGGNSASFGQPAPVPDDGFVEEVRRLAAETGPDGFAFDDVARLSDVGIHALLPKLDQKSLVVALIGAQQPTRDRLLGNMSPRVQTFILEETGLVRDTSAADVAATHAAIANQVVPLARQGEVTLP
jgi:chemotaxis protein MotA